jgi:crotonobetainyl-CoA:carnitine CoA-transferase CaiB-like acyl-CoA transferase
MAASRVDWLITASFAICAPDTGGARPRGTPQKHKRKQRSRKPNDPRRVLMYGKILELALYRAEVLRARGFNVIIPRTKADAISAIEDGEFDAIVISYTLSSDTAEEIAELARQKCPGCPVITISETGKADRRLRPDVIVRADEGPSGLVKALEHAFRAQ